MTKDEEIKLLEDLLLDVIFQACGGDNNEMFSMALTSYAEGIRELGVRKRVKIIDDNGGRMVRARW